jgi:hypothetical protein
MPETTLNPALNYTLEERCLFVVIIYLLRRMVLFGMLNVN